ncbi:MAG: neutral/alkaline non-lysosomal ceramidase N-terminal domain-containing protein [Bacteroidetes bacterium]|nr:neutral/alkaline non-lysosomal ceramidase N-terminal domain-containing protein [Bacteroidota bacterium]MBS1748219.1 neutral/alkaline non-lysosomal ceramidase N-terminal domain-containing protein [Bacteroidota bacterium]
MEIKLHYFQTHMIRVKEIMILLILVLFCLLSITTSAQKKSVISSARGFRASIIKINITPDKPKQLLGYGPRVSTGVYDSIYHRIVVLDDGTTQFFLVSSDVCLISPSEYDYMASILQKKLGINPGNFWWTVTHTHSAPEVGAPGLLGVFLGDRYEHPVDTAYASFIQQSLFNGIVEAQKNLTPARMGVGWGFSQANINRRAIDIDGKGSIGLNPDGPVDRRIGLIRLEKQDGSPLALIANYPIHGTVMGGDFVEISGDAPGVVSEYVEQKAGAPLVFINGAAGNLAPIYSVYPDAKSGHLSQFKVLLGDKILDANKNIHSTLDSIKLVTGAITIETPLRPNLAWPSDMKNYTGVTKDNVTIVKLPVRFLKINNDVAIWSTPLELFCEIANTIRELSPFPYTFYYGYTNGWLGYLPSADQWKYGGYEVDVVSPFTPVMSNQLIETVAGYLQGEMRSTQTINHPNKKRNANSKLNDD